MHARELWRTTEYLFLVSEDLAILAYCRECVGRRGSLGGMWLSRASGALTREQLSPDQRSAISGLACASGSNMWKRAATQHATIVTSV
jgi:hypothetical protein